MKAGDQEAKEYYLEKQKRELEVALGKAKEARGRLLDASRTVRCAESRVEKMKMRVELAKERLKDANRGLNVARSAAAKVIGELDTALAYVEKMRVAVKQAKVAV